MRCVRISFSLIIAALSVNSFSQDPGATNPRDLLSDKAEITLITQWPGQEIYLSWGHSAFRVKDTQRNIDEVFNYGTFNLEDPWFIPLFVRGELNYFLDEYPFQPYLDWDVRNENRQWQEQVLNLDAGERDQLFKFLVWNAQPANATYRYDFIRDNCSTRIRDALERILGKRLVYPTDVQTSDWESYRSGIDRGVKQERGFAFMFNLVLGTASDQTVGLRESTWQPIVLKRLLDRSMVVHNGHTQALVSQTRVIYAPPGGESVKNADFDPVWVLWPLAILGLIAAGWRLFSGLWGKPWQSRMVYRLADGLFFLAVGLLSALLLYLNFWSDHTAVKGNFNLIWLLPSHLVAAFFLFRRRRPTWLAWYYGLGAVACLVPWILIPIWPQVLKSAMLPAMLLLFARCLAQTGEIWPQFVKSNQKRP